MVMLTCLGKGMVMQRRLLTVLILTVLVLAFAAVSSASAATIYVN